MISLYIEVNYVIRHPVKVRRDVKITMNGFVQRICILPFSITSYLVIFYVGISQVSKIFENIRMLRKLRYAYL